MKKLNLTKKTIVKAIMFALLVGSPVMMGVSLTFNVNAQTSPNMADAGPQDGGDGPKKPRPCHPSLENGCHPSTNLTSGGQASTTADGDEPNWLDGLWEWIFG